MFHYFSSESKIEKEQISKMKSEKISITKKVEIMKRIVERLYMYRSVERALIENIDGISIFDFTTDLDNAWKKAFKFFKDSLFLSSILLLLKYSKRSLGDILSFFREIFPLAQAEANMKYKCESVARKVVFRLNLLSAIGGLSVGIIIGLFFIFGAFQNIVNQFSWIYGIFLLVLIITSIALGAYKLDIMVTLIVLNDTLSDKVRIRPILLALCFSLLAFVLVFSLLMY